MKKLFLVCLMMLAGSAWAEWVIYETTDTNTFYYDPTTIRKDGNMRQVWVLLNWRKRDKDNVMSHTFTKSGYPLDRYCSCHCCRSNVQNCLPQVTYSIGHKAK